MSRAEVLVEYYGLALKRLMADAQELWQDCRPESPTPARIAQCQARKVAMLARAQEAGLLREEVRVG